jgi:hypothetical protein
MPWLFAGAVIVVAVFGIAFAVLLTGNKTPLGPPHHHNPQALAAASPAATASTPSASPTHKPAHKHAHSASPSPTPQPAPQPPANPTNAASVQLAATVSADNGHDWGHVIFQVDNTGAAATGQLTATITLPAGASMTGGGGGGGGGGDAVLSPFDGNSGWTCQPTSTGATCTHAGLAAGAQSWGAIFFTVSGGSVCGQPVEFRAASGSSSVSAHSTVGC